MRQYFVYIMTNRSRTLYTGMTNDLMRRVEEHRSKLVPGFTSKYNITRLVYWEEFRYVRDAIAREKEIKGWLRSKKIALINSVIPNGTTCHAARSKASQLPWAWQRPNADSSLRSE